MYSYGEPVSARFTTIDPIRDGSNWFSYVVNDPVNYVDPLGLTATDSKGGNVTFNQNVFSNPFVGYNEPQVTFETSSQTNNSYYGIDTGNSILVACGSMSTIGNCFGSKANKGFSFGDGTTLGHNDVYIGGQNNESQSSKMIKQASIEFFIGSLLDNGAPLIGGAIAFFTGGSGALAIPVIKAVGISFEIDATAKLAKGILLAVEENSGSDSNHKKSESNSENKPNYEHNLKHHPNSKNPEPKNAEDLYNNSVKDSAGNYWYKDKSGNIHRFQGSDGYNASRHWNGSTHDLKPLKENHIPNDIKNLPKGDLDAIW